MLNIQNLLVIFVAFVEICGQRSVGDVCTIESSGKPGVCTLFRQCQEALANLRNQNRFPQTCGFKGTQSIVCCPKKEQPPREPGAISKRKCREYSSYVYSVTRSPILKMKSTDIKRFECGHKVVKLIVGGEKAGRNEFPHMAAIGYEQRYEPTPDDNIQWLCGGTILSKNYVLTAAHCLSPPEQGDAKWVKIGVTALNDTNTSHLQNIQVAELIPHPEYIFGSHYHDIGLLKLKRPARMNPYARPACLYLKDEISARQSIATGWGQTSWYGSGSNDLLKVTIDLFDHATCNASYKNQIGRRLSQGIVDDIQVCAGSDTQEKDTCLGDSGGPLQIYHVGDEVKCMYDIVGVTSFGKGCAGSPGIYVRVSHYVKWIEDIVWPQHRSFKLIMNNTPNSFK